MGEDNNILNGGVDVLNEIKASILAVENVRGRIAELGEKQKTLEKDIAAKQKAMDTEITSVVSKRQAEVEKTYDEQLAGTRDRIKRVKAKKDKFKDSKVSERIDNETSYMREQVRGLKADLKGIFTREHIPGIFNTDYFFSMFLPEHVGDFCVILISIIILLALPAGIFVLLPANLHKWWMAVILYAVVLVIGMTIFMMIYKSVRNKHLQALEQARNIRGQIRNVRKRIGQMTRSIRSDKDESGYGLEKFEQELAELDGQVNGLVEQKKQALAEFENNTKLAITNEIKARYMDSITQMKAENEAAYDEQRQLENNVKAASLDISSRYEAYIGKENLTPGMIDSLIEIINSNDAENIAEALEFYRKQTGASASVKNTAQG
ncbi:MAG: hypothetical protein K6G81_03405 [Lachnospiraceae bacterium]|nr:hypothetical protein [Lachnospiraceae bacterium]